MDLILVPREPGKSNIVTDSDSRDLCSKQHTAELQWSNSEAVPEHVHSCLETLYRCYVADLKLLMK